MGLQDFWFIALAALFIGFLVLEGFDFGVGMLMKFFGRRAPDGEAEQHERAVLNTIGPVWDGNEVWLITAGGAMFAAFPEMYATVFSGLYLPLLAILVAMIVRICAIEWRGKIDDPRWRSWADVAHRGRLLGARRAVGRRVRGPGARPTRQRGQADPAVRSPICSTGYVLLGGLATARTVRLPRCRLRRAEDRGSRPRRRRAASPPGSRCR